MHNKCLKNCGQGTSILKLRNWPYGRHLLGLLESEWTIFGQEGGAGEDILVTTYPPIVYFTLNGTII